MHTELEIFRRQPKQLLESAESFKTLVWWAFYDKDYPYVAAMVRLLGDIFATKVECKSIFSVSGILQGVD